LDGGGAFHETGLPTLNNLQQSLKDRVKKDEANVGSCILVVDDDKMMGESMASLLEANPFVERFFGILRRELLNHMIPVNEWHCYRLIKEYVDDYYHSERPHMGLEGDTPNPHSILSHSPARTKLKAIPNIGGLHHRYQKVIA